MAFSEAAKAIIARLKAILPVHFENDGYETLFPNSLNDVANLLPEVATQIDDITVQAKSATDAAKAAGTSAGAAKTSADNAEVSRRGAVTSADNAAGSATRAKGSEDGAAASARTATEQATAAGGSATSAATSLRDANTARQGAESAREGANRARGDAETARDASQAAARASADDAAGSFSSAGASESFARASTLASVDAASFARDASASLNAARAVEGGVERTRADITTMLNALGVTYRWQGTKLSLRLPDGTYGPEVDLIGGKGDQGDRGDSAYIRALANGFVGSESAWLESLKGDPRLLIDDAIMRRDRTWSSVQLQSVMDAFVRDLRPLRFPSDIGLGEQVLSGRYGPGAVIGRLDESLGLAYDNFSSTDGEFTLQGDGTITVTDTLTDYSDYELSVRCTNREGWVKTFKVIYHTLDVALPLPPVPAGVPIGTNFGAYDQLLPSIPPSSGNFFFTAGSPIGTNANRN